MSNGNTLQLNQLTKLSSAIALLSPELSRYYLLNRADCTANSLKASSYKLSYCKICYSSLIPGKNSKITINSNTKPSKNAVLNLQTDAPIKVDKSEK
jgi:RNase P subunit RPR2